MSNSLNSLYRCADAVQDHFRRLGGSNRYSRFMNWYIPAFVLLINQNEAMSEILPFDVWRNTQTLQTEIASKLLAEPPSANDIAKFVERTTQQTSKFKEARENIEWLEFSKSIKYEAA